MANGERLSQRMTNRKRLLPTSTDRIVNGFRKETAGRSPTTNSATNDDQSRTAFARNGQSQTTFAEKRLPIADDFGGEKYDRTAGRFPRENRDDLRRQRGFREKRSATDDFREKRATNRREGGFRRESAGFPRRNVENRGNRRRRTYFFCDERAAKNQRENSKRNRLESEMEIKTKTRTGRGLEFSSEFRPNCATNQWPTIYDGGVRSRDRHSRIEYSNLDISSTNENGDEEKNIIIVEVGRAK